jgi:hypothetical protein
MMTSGRTAGSAGSAIAEIPSGIDGVTPQWLTGVLDSATVSDVRVEHIAAKGAGATDIGYLVSQGLPTEVRRGQDEMLVHEYLERLAEHGVTDYSFDEAWRHYRFAAAYFVVLPAMPLLSWDALPERSRQLCMRLVERAVATIDETEAMEVFE